MIDSDDCRSSIPRRKARFKRDEGKKTGKKAEEEEGGELFVSKGLKEKRFYAIIYVGMY